MRRIAHSSAVACCLLLAGAAEGGGAGELADFIARSSGTPGGICVVVEARDPGCAESLAGRDTFVVQALYGDPAAVVGARRVLRASGRYGRASAVVHRGPRLPYAENLVNILVVDGYPERTRGGVGVREMLRVLTPRGAAYVGDSRRATPGGAAWANALAAEFRREGVVDVEVHTEAGTWVRAVKPWPAEIDEWSHFLHGADGNPVADDTILGPPEHYQWVSGPQWLRSHETVSSVATLVTAGGRLFCIVDQAPISLTGQHELPDKWALVARDAFNGVALWRVPIEQWGWRQWKTSWFSPRPGDYPFNIQKRLVATADRVYVTLGYHAAVSELDARTGKVLRTYEGTEDTVELLHADDVLILSVLRGDRLRLAAVDARGGRRLWTSERSYTGVTTDYLKWRAMRGAIEPPARLTPTLNTATDGRIVAFLDGNAVAAVSFADGVERWRTEFQEKGPASPVRGVQIHGLWVGTLIVKDGCVLHASPSTLACFSASDGSLRWSHAKQYLGHLWYEWKDVFVIDGLVWTWSDELEREPLAAGGSGQGAKAPGRSVWPATVNGYDLRTGKVEKRVPLGKIFKTYHHHRCYRNKATSRYILASRRGTEYVDLVKGAHSVHNWVRGTCHVGMMPANGLQYAPPHPCVCYMDEKLNGMTALAPALPMARRAVPATPAPALERGPAYGALRGDPAGDEDWPTYRADIGRSGSVKTRLAAGAGLRWRSRLGGRLAATISVADRLYVPMIDAHHLVALDGATGEILWEFAAGARIDSPPTYVRGALIFGCRDGRVYCLRASDGALAWKLRAAPQERSIGAFGQLESAWPVHGSVLVLDGVAYFAAGRTSHLDGGLYLYGVDVETGEVRHGLRAEGPRYTVADIEQNYRLPMGTLPDIMQSDGASIFMRDVRFDPRLARQRGTPRLRVASGFLDDAYFKRAPWRHPYCGYGRLIVLEGACAYCARMFDSLEGLNPNVYFTPGRAGYLLTAAEGTKRRERWSQRVRIRIRAMVATDGVLCVAGPPDVVEAGDPLGAFEGRKGAVLRLVDSGTGATIAEHELPSPPVFNGATAARGRLFVCLEDGSVVCVGR